MSIYEFGYTSIEEREIRLSEYSGRVLLIVNTASKCGFASQYKGLEEVYQVYKDRGLVVIGFPCNQFMGQEPLNEKQISEFCSMRYGVTFPLSQKVDVKGTNTAPLFKYLKEQKGFIGFGRGAKAKMMSLFTCAKQGESEIQWNFTKFLIDKNGNVVARYEPTTEPKDIAPDIERLLG